MFATLLAWAIVMLYLGILLGGLACFILALTHISPPDY